MNNHDEQISLLFEGINKKENKEYKIFLRETSDGIFSFDLIIGEERIILSSGREISKNEIVEGTNATQLDLLKIIMEGELKVENNLVNENNLGFEEIKKRLIIFIEDVCLFVKGEYKEEDNDNQGLNLEQTLDDDLSKVTELMGDLVVENKEEESYEKRIHSHKYLTNNKKLKYYFKESGKTVLGVHFSSKSELEDNIRSGRDEVNIDVINEELSDENKIIGKIKIFFKYKRKMIIFGEKNIFSMRIEGEIRGNEEEIKEKEIVVKDFTYDYIADLMNKQIKKIIEKFI